MIKIKIEFKSKFPFFVFSIIYMNHYRCWDWKWSSISEPSNDIAYETVGSICK